MTHIAIDLDDVVLDFMGGVRHAISNEFGIDLAAEDIDKWDIKDVLDPIIGRSWWSWLRDREWLWANFPTMPGAIGGIEKLRSQGHYLEIVTSKPRWAEHNTWKWLGKWRPSVQRVTIVGATDRKVDFTDAQILIDDKPENIEDFLAENRQGILFKRPHNLGTVLAVHRTREGRVLSADSWRDIPDLVEALRLTVVR
jgi:5'(3')-deoxyribonucleotidase